MRSLSTFSRIENLVSRGWLRRPDGRPFRHPYVRGLHHGEPHHFQPGIPFQPGRLRARGLAQLVRGGARESRESGPFRVLGSYPRALNSGPKFGMPALEVGSQLLIEHAGSYLQQPMCAVWCPPHLLFLDEMLTDHLVDRRFERIPASGPRRLAASSLICMKASDLCRAMR
jgi:hypothetical protein